MLLQAQLKLMLCAFIVGCKHTTVKHLCCRHDVRNVFSAISLLFGLYGVKHFQRQSRSFINTRKCSVKKKEGLFGIVLWVSCSWNLQWTVAWHNVFDCGGMREVHCRRAQEHPSQLVSFSPRSTSSRCCPTPTWSTCRMPPASTSPSFAPTSNTASVSRPWRRSSSRTCHVTMALQLSNISRQRTTASTAEPVLEETETLKGGATQRLRPGLQTSNWEILSVFISYLAVLTVEIWSDMSSDCAHQPLPQPPQAFQL